MSVRRLNQHCRAFAARLAKARSGVAYIEFAYVFPPVMIVGLLGIEAANYTQTNQRISQIALSMADNTSRIGQETALANTQFREADVLDSFIGAEKQAGRLDIKNKGRIILSSLERNAAGNQYFHWQRCTGSLKRNGTLIQSAYGKQGAVSNGSGATKLNPTGIAAPADNAVMFVEIYYEYEPLVTGMLVGKEEIKYTASFIVRDKRNLTGDTNRTGKYGNVYNPSPAVPDSQIGFC